jgi:hypothetical protein
VAAASPNDEADWIEWKSAIDPEPEGRSENDRLAHPGNGEPLTGVAEVDLAVLDQGIQAS